MDRVVLIESILKRKGSLLLKMFLIFEFKLFWFLVIYWFRVFCEMRLLRILVFFRGWVFIYIWKNRKFGRKGGKFSSISWFVLNLFILCFLRGS